MYRLILGLVAVLCVSTAHAQVDRRQVKWLFQNSPQYIAPAQYDIWWDELIVAVNAPPATLELIVWHEGPARGFACPINATALCVGQWLSTGDIFIARQYQFDKRVVKHEMLHAILGTHEHPAIFAHLGLL